MTLSFVSFAAWWQYRYHCGRHKIFYRLSRSFWIFLDLSLCLSFSSSCIVIGDHPACLASRPFAFPSLDEF